MAPDLVEAAVRLGQLSQAAEAAGRFSRWASLVGQPWADALHVRCQALIASDSEAERHYWLRVDDQTNTWILRLLAQARTSWLTDVAGGIKAAGSGWGSPCSACQWWR
jgi:hypothetical protein